jgi:hypothetical protein
MIGPLRAVGWAVSTEIYRDLGNFEYRPSAACRLRRGSQEIDVEYLDETLNLFLRPDTATDEEPAPSTTVDASEPAEAEALYRSTGLLR